MCSIYLRNERGVLKKPKVNLRLSAEKLGTLQLWQSKRLLVTRHTEPAIDSQCSALLPNKVLTSGLSTKTAWSGICQTWKKPRRKQQLFHGWYCSYWQKARFFPNKYKPSIIRMHILTSSPKLKHRSHSLPLLPGPVPPVHPIHKARKNNLQSS